MKKIFLALPLVFTVGCIATPKTTVNPIIGYSGKFDGINKICVVVPSDSSFGNESYEGSGRNVAQKLSDSLSRIGFSSVLIKSTTDPETLSCSERGGNFILSIKILHYEDHATGWSGKPDRIEIKIAAYRPNETSIQRTVVFEAFSNVAASGLLEWGNPQPSELLDTNLDPVLRKLINGSE